MNRLLAGAAVIALLAGGATQGAPKRSAAPSPRTGHCQAGETVVYSCRFGRAVGSVCAVPGRISYRFGPLGKAPELAISSTPDWSNVHIGRITGGGGGYQTHLRFSVEGHDYIVFEGMGGQLTEIPGKRWSGISVWRGETEFPSRSCALPASGTTGSFEQVWDFVPSASRTAVEEGTKRFEAWF